MKVVGTNARTTYGISVAEFMKAFKIKGEVTSIRDYFTENNDTDNPDEIHIDVVARTGAFSDEG